jgi:2-aminoethylphosphonate-pyruvate transaminase
MDETRREPFLLTPGPLTTTAATKAAMLRDWGSRDGEFIAMNARVRRRLLELVSGDGSHVCVPLQGSGTFIVEAMIGTLVPPAGKLLVLVNGAYGRRMVRICEYYRRACVAQETAEDQPVDPAALDARLGADPAITHVVVVHCETSSGVLNAVEEIAAVVARRGRRLLIDAMSAFGALPLDARRVPFDAVVASANKCLEGVPGVAFAIVRREALEEARGQAPSLSLDLHDQWTSMEKNGQWRFTPPTHVIAAFDRALEQHAAEGGVAGRGGRYRRNCALLVAGLRALGFETLLPDRLQAPIIVTVKMPAAPTFHFETFYARRAQRGYVIYPGKLTVADSFRIGCIGALGEGEMAGALRAITEVMGELGVASGAPAAG